MMKHQEAFDALKEVLSTAPALGYPNFSGEVILETDASLNGSGTILSHQGKDGKFMQLLMQAAPYMHLKDPCKVTAHLRWN